MTKEQFLSESGIAIKEVQAASNSSIVIAADGDVANVAMSGNMVTNLASLIGAYIQNPQMHELLDSFIAVLNDDTKRRIFVPYAPEVVSRID